MDASASNAEPRPNYAAMTREERWEIIRRNNMKIWGTERAPPVSELIANEKWWAAQYEWLKAAGYQLRPRYAPGWKASWVGHKNKTSDNSEDGQVLKWGSVIDATRTRDGKIITLKWTKKASNPEEMRVQKFFSEEPRASDPRNRCLPLLEVLEVPNDEERVILVLPLVRTYNSPPIDTVGEAVVCLKQVFEGVQFMHKHNATHGDIKYDNIMMDPTPLFKEPYHPQAPELTLDAKRSVSASTRTWNPVRYYLIDFGLSRIHEDVSSQRVQPDTDGSSSLPEKNARPQYNPFSTDLYCLGEWIKDDFLEQRTGFEFLAPFVEELMQEDASKRPTIDEAVARLDNILDGLSSWKLRSHSRHRDDVWKRFRVFSHWPRRVLYVVLQRPAIPMP